QDELGHTLCPAALVAGPRGPKPPPACSCPLTRYVRQLDRDMADCWDQHAGAVPTMPDPHWFLSMSSRLAGAADARLAVWWRSDDHRRLEELNEWVTGQGLPVVASTVPPPWAGALTEGEVRELHAYWQQICTVYVRLFAQNVFCRTSHLPFWRWRNDMLIYV
ncbi:MAG: hypothetical protein ACRC33_13515, partial [Gemmataceae bacterium]